MSIAGEVIRVDKRSIPLFLFKDWKGMVFQRDIDITVVLVAGQIDDYAAYIAAGDEQFAKVHGNKLAFEEACAYFPGLEEGKYRK